MYSNTVMGSKDMIKSTPYCDVMPILEVSEHAPRDELKVEVR